MEGILANGYIAVEKINEEEVSAGGIIFSGVESGKMVVDRGEVLFISDDIKNNASEESRIREISAGWILYYNKGGSFDLRLENGKSYTMVHIRDAIWFIPPATIH